MWVYVKSERTNWTVGFYRPDGTWESESDHSTPDSAAQRCNYLNGGKGWEWREQLPGGGGGTPPKG